MGKIKNISLLKGKYVILREVIIADADFILSLRCDEKKSRFIHKTEYNLDKQIEYLNRYLTLANEWYFIIENKLKQPIGTIRIYDLHEDSFCDGSWIMVDGVSTEEAIESTFLLKQFGFEELGFSKSHCDVRKNNKKVINFHKLMGAELVREDELNYYFIYEKNRYYECVRSFL